MGSSENHTIAGATRSDVSDLHRLICGLADYEKLSALVTGTEDDLTEALFGDRPACEALILRVTDAKAPVGFALYFHNFSTFLGRRGLYLEDIFVEPAFRGRGLGRALLIRLAQIALERKCGRFEWSVLDWNVDAQGFYQSLGATILPDWRITRLTGESLARLAAL
jgi:GNAT superfamily N-acetyltransferase